MATAKNGVRLFTPNNAQTWYQPEGRRIFLGDVLDETNSNTMGIGFARYAPGQSNEWVVTYDADKYHDRPLLDHVRGGNQSVLRIRSVFPTPRAILVASI